MSCGVIGFDKNFWTVYGFFDGDHDEEEQDAYLYEHEDGTYSADPPNTNVCTSPSTDSEHSETSTAQVRGRFWSDPVSGGKLDAAMPRAKPREYFLQILEIRAGKMARRWGNLVSMHLKDAIRRQVRPPLSLCLNPDAHRRLVPG